MHKLTENCCFVRAFYGKLNIRTCNGSDMRLLGALRGGSAKLFSFCSGPMGMDRKGQIFMMNLDFQISDELTRAIDDMGYEEATPIQAAAIPPLLQGRDMIGQAQTGTGKTAAFGIPLIESLDLTVREVQALVLCPTRELALQVAGELIKFARYRRGVRVLPVYGGQPIERQLRGLREGAQVVVGTPGRVMDHMNRGSLNLGNVKMVILDEADEMLDMGFRDDIETILKETPETRQTALFSATMPREIVMLARRYLKDPARVTIESRELTVESIRQSYFVVRSFHKTELLSRLLLRDQVALALVFCNTKRAVDDVVADLSRRGFQAAGLHGDLRQIERDVIMSRFRSGQVQVLVATDVAARGLDIDDIELVVNYDVPQDVEYYVHRIGRTGRAGKAGRAYTFAVGRETTRMWEYRRITGATILCEQPPDARAIHSAKAEALMERLTSGDEIQQDEDTLAMADRVLAQGNARKAVASMIEMLVDSTGVRIDPSIDLMVREPARETAGVPSYPRNRAAKPYGQSAARSGSGYGNRSGGSRYPQRSAQHNNGARV